MNRGQWRNSHRGCFYKKILLKRFLVVYFRKWMTFKWRRCKSASWTMFSKHCLLKKQVELVPDTYREVCRIDCSSQLSRLTATLTWVKQRRALVCPKRRLSKRERLPWELPIENWQWRTNWKPPIENSQEISLKICHAPGYLNISEYLAPDKQKLLPLCITRRETKTKATCFQWSCLVILFSALSVQTKTRTAYVAVRRKR